MKVTIENTNPTFGGVKNDRGQEKHTQMKAQASAMPIDPKFVPDAKDLRLIFKLDTPMDRFRFVSYVGYEMTVGKLIKQIGITVEELDSILNMRPCEKYMTFQHGLSDYGYNPFWIINNLGNWKSN